MLGALLSVGGVGKLMAKGVDKTPPCYGPPRHIVDESRDDREHRDIIDNTTTCARSISATSLITDEESTMKSSLSTLYVPKLARDEVEGNNVAEPVSVAVDQGGGDDERAVQQIVNSGVIELDYAGRVVEGIEYRNDMTDRHDASLHGDTMPPECGQEVELGSAQEERSLAEFSADEDLVLDTKPKKANKIAVQVVRHKKPTKRTDNTRLVTNTRPSKLSSPSVRKAAKKKDIVSDATQIRSVIFSRRKKKKKRLAETKPKQQVVDEQDARNCQTEQSTVAASPTCVTTEKRLLGQKYNATVDINNTATSKPAKKSAFSSAFTMCVSHPGDKRNIIEKAADGTLTCCGCDDVTLGEAAATDDLVPATDTNFLFEEAHSPRVACKTSPHDRSTNKNRRDRRLPLRGSHKKPGALVRVRSVGSGKVRMNKRARKRGGNSLLDSNASSQNVGGNTKCRRSKKLLGLPFPSRRKKYKQGTMGYRETKEDELTTNVSEDDSDDFPQGFFDFLAVQIAEEAMKLF